MLMKKYSKELIVNFKQWCGENKTCIADLHVDMEFLDSNQYDYDYSQSAQFDQIEFSGGNLSIMSSALHHHSF
jgi:hypothetical protein